ncbi:hypothetical protein BDQ17DRAFT_1368979 [Cyathus striatus]|nr:hypothetical protein BDQ17DRAFT_1368979 [Cyathus striatus]
MYRHGAPVNMGPPYPHDFPPPVDASYPVKYGPIPQVPPRPASFPSSTQDSYRDAGRTNVFSNPFPSGQDNNYYDAWGSLNGNSPSNPGRIVGKYNEMNWDILKRLAMNQQVEVNLSARGWVVGAVVSCLQFFKCISGQGYNIRYRTLEGETVEQPFPARPDFIKPFF